VQLGYLENMAEKNKTGKGKGGSDSPRVSRRSYKKKKKKKRKKKKGGPVHSVKGKTKKPDISKVGRVSGLRRGSEKGDLLGSGGGEKATRSVIERMVGYLSQRDAYE